ncbi:MAG: hypothetical protein ACXU7X_10110 [Croceibacterium sp.]
MLNTEPALTTGSMQLTAHAFEPPAAKPLPLWAIVCAVVLLALAANVVYSWLRPAQPPPPTDGVTAPKPRDERPSSSATPLVVHGQGMNEPASAGAAAAPPSLGRPGQGRSSECTKLDQDIRALDAAARVLLAADQQSTIRAARERGRARQLALGC